MKDLLTVNEAAEYIRLSRATLYRLVEAGKLKVYRIGGGKKTFFKRDDLDNLVQPDEKTTVAHEDDQPKQGLIIEAA